MISNCRFSFKFTFSCWLLNIYYAKLKCSKQRVRGISCQLGIENAKLSLPHSRYTEANLAHSCYKQESVVSTCDFNTVLHNTLIQDHELQTLQHWSGRSLKAG
ncbi:hypothetical protein O6H91_06G071900 [Diphasiastrum complanatum]|uniref:Uncharacterized protein n=1 Tax=Diphasiastrum complanatum TaxID=34168 RepID=A0ACC2DFD9_DIPCM|nr:hypothetical protein O6H91_06G071900 [Diphasiastrum complanatum]